MKYYGVLILPRCLKTQATQILLSEFLYLTFLNKMAINVSMYMIKK